MRQSNKNTLQQTMQDLETYGDGITVSMTRKDFKQLLNEIEMQEDSERYYVDATEVEHGWIIRKIVRIEG